MTVNSAQVFLPDLYNNQAGVTLVTGPDRSASSECGATGSSPLTSSSQEYYINKTLISSLMQLNPLSPR